MGKWTLRLIKCGFRNSAVAAKSASGRTEMPYSTRNYSLAKKLTSALKF